MPLLVSCPALFSAHCGWARDYAAARFRQSLASPPVIDRNGVITCMACPRPSSKMATSASTLHALSIDDELSTELKCGVCLELFKDPRCLPCLHTFCMECIQRTMNDDCFLKCPICRAKHELGQEGAGLLPVNLYALQKLPLKRLKQQQGDVVKMCESCGEAESHVAWCSDCRVLICKLCYALHKKMVYLKGHRIIDSEGHLQSHVEKRLTNVCLRHDGQELKYLCTDCSAMVCPECLLSVHKDHEYSLAEEAHQKLETKMKELIGVAETKKEEFCGYLKRLNVAEGKAIEYTENVMKKVVNSVFDAAVASLETQRSEVLQNVSEGVKKIWSQKELIEVSLAQLDSFTRFADHTSNCATSRSYVAMATQCIKLMKHLQDVQGDEDALDSKMIAIGPEYDAECPLRLPLDELFKVGCPTITFKPTPGSEYSDSNGSALVGMHKVTIEVSLKIQGLPVFFLTSSKTCHLDSQMVYDRNIIPTEVTEISSSKLSWEITGEFDVCRHGYKDLVVQCTFSGLLIKFIEVAYKV